MNIIQILKNKQILFQIKSIIGIDKKIINLMILIFLMLMIPNLIKTKEAV